MDHNNNNNINNNSNNNLYVNMNSIQVNENNLNKSSIKDIDMNINSDNNNNNAFNNSNDHVVYMFGSKDYNLLLDASTDNQPSNTDNNSIFSVSIVPSLCKLNLISMAPGLSHICSVNNSGSVIVWGLNDEGQLGIKTNSNSIVSSATQLHSLETHWIVSVSSNYNHTAVISRNGELLTFGSNSFGQLGNNLSTQPPRTWDMNNHSLPQLCREFVNLGLKVVKVSCGENHTIALTSIGSVYCAGDASRYQLGLEVGKYFDPKDNRTIRPVFTPIKALDPVPIVDIATGSFHSLFLTSTGQIFSCGSNKRGQCGAPLTFSLTNDSNNIAAHSVLLPKLISSIENVFIRRIYAAGNSSFAIDNSGLLYSFGDNHNGILGHNNRDNYTQPTIVQFFKQQNIHIKLFSVSTSHALALDNNNNLYSWCSGCAALGLPNNINNDDILQPTPVPFNAGSNRYILTINAGNYLSSVITVPSSVNYNGESTGGVDSFDCKYFMELLSGNNISAATYNKAIQYINNVFSHPTALSASFINPHQSIDIDSKSYDNVTNSYAIDVESLEQVYNKLLWQARIEPRLSHTLHTAAQKSINYLLNRTKTSLLPTNFSAYRAILIILQSPHFIIGDHKEVSLLCDIASLVKRIPNSAKQTMKLILSQTPRSTFELRYVRMLIQIIEKKLILEKTSIATTAVENYIKANYNSQTQLQLQTMANEILNNTKIKQLPEDIQNLIELLSLFYEAANITNIVTDQVFHIEHINKLVDLEHHFKIYSTFERTKQSRNNNNIQSAELPPFSLCYYNYLLDPQAKSSILRIEHSFQQQFQAYMNVMQLQSPYLHIKVHRDNIVRDTIYAINSLDTQQLKQPLKIEFIGEQGLDAGGVQREFFLLCCRELLSHRYDLFTINNDTKLLWYSYNPIDPSKQSLYTITGIIFGLAVYNGVSIEAEFPQLFYKQLLDQKIELDDLLSVDPVIATNMKHLLHYNSNDFEQVFALNFAVNKPKSSSINQTNMDNDGNNTNNNDIFELIPNGNNISVNLSNRDEYVRLYLEYIYINSVKSASNAFVAGFHSIINPKTSLAIKLFKSIDLELLLIGKKDLDFNILKQNAVYEGGYNQNSAIIKSLWDILINKFSNEERIKFLVFLTGSSRIPLAILADLRLMIQRSGPDTQLLPTSHTCFSTLLLPEYSSYDKLLNKLRTAINNAEGFGLQ